MTGLVGYYRDRAAEYDTVYTKPERQPDLAMLHDMLPQHVAGLRVLEIAAGTGYWTQVLSRSATAITATDVNTEPLDVARTRQYGPASVTFDTADAYALDQVPGDYDAVFIGFFWSHILRADIPCFVAGLHARLGAGSKLIVLDTLRSWQQYPHLPHDGERGHIPTTYAERRAQLRDRQELPDA